MNEPSLLRDMLGFVPASGSSRVPARPTLAVIGLSDDPHKPSHYVSAFMQRVGYRILPVNPSLTSVLGEPAFPSLHALPERPDVVNVFRLPRYIPAIVEDMIALGLRDLWVQLGIVNLPAAERAEAAGLRVVMDRCIQVEYARLAPRYSPTHQ